MILLDTHIFFWWVDSPHNLTERYREIIRNNEGDRSVGLSIISLWEIAKLYEKKRIQLSISLDEWLTSAIKYPGIKIIPLSNEIIIDSVNLPGAFHNDPADQLIVSTARTMDIELLTMDGKILNYSHVKLFRP